MSTRVWVGANVHFRTRRGDEVDFVLETRDGIEIEIEAKSSATVRSGDFAGLRVDFAGLRVLEEIAGHRFRRCVVLYTRNDVVSFGPKLVAAPV